jgi:hypothetical protein
MHRLPEKALIREIVNLLATGKTRGKPHVESGFQDVSMQQEFILEVF